MKYQGHIKTGEFEFIQIESDNRDEVIEEYHAIKALFEDKEGLPDKEWNAVTDGYLNTNTMQAEVYESLSREQKDKIQWAKRSMKRIKSKLIVNKE